MNKSPNFSILMEEKIISCSSNSVICVFKWAAFNVVSQGPRRLPSVDSTNFEISVVINL